MSWEWEYRTNPQRWTLDMGEWHAVVQRLDGLGYQWHAYIKSTSEPLIRHEGPTNKDPILGRTWCLMKIAELRREKQ